MKTITNKKIFRQFHKTDSQVILLEKMSINRRKKKHRSLQFFILPAFFFLMIFITNRLMAEVDVVSSSENELKVKVTVLQVKFREQQFADGKTYSVIIDPGAGILAIGKPDVPGYGNWILIPNGRGVSVTVEKGTPLIYENINLPPVQPPAPDIPGAGNPPFTKDEAAFSTDNDYPGVLANTEPVKYRRGQPCTILWVYPYQYNPVRKTLTVYPDLEVTVHFTGNTEPVPANLRSESNDRLLRAIAINGDTVLDAEKDITGQSMDGIDYQKGSKLLIITHPLFKDAADTLAQWKRRKGISTHVLVTDTTPSTYDIKAYIDSTYTHWEPAPSYLLFIGDAEFIPTWHLVMHPDSANQGRIGTDLFYADYQNANVNPSIKFDFLPELFYGRLPVDTKAQADSLVNRIIRYEKNLVTYDGFYEQATMVAYFQDNDKDSIADRRFVKTTEDVKNYLDNHGYIANRIYCTNSYFPKYWSTYHKYIFENDTAKQEIPEELQKPNFQWNGNASEIKSKINEGAFLTLYSDHGSRNAWCNPHFSESDVNALANYEKRPVIWSAACQNGWFDNETDDAISNTGVNDECFAESWLHHNTGGSCMVFAATRISFSGFNDRLVWGWMDAIWPYFTSWFGDPFGTSKPFYRMGEVMQYGKDYVFVRTPGGDWQRAIFQEYQVFGDPTMEMWTAEPDIIQTLEPENTIVAGNNKVAFGIWPKISNVLIAVYSESKKELLGIGYTNISGISEISLNDTIVLNEKLQITATKHNYLPKETIITVEAGESGYITADKIWSDDTIKVVGNITVEKDVTLTVNAGVYVEFEGHYEINVYGRLLAVGALSDTIVFSPKDKSTGWHGIRFIDTDTTNQYPSKLNYCKFIYGKANWGDDVNDPNGGAILCTNSSGVIIDHCLISENYADFSGGAIYCDHSDIQLKNSVVISNKSTKDGGGISIMNSNPEIYNVLISGNIATTDGGGISCYLDSKPEITKAAIRNNHSTNHGGGVYLEGLSQTNAPHPVFDSVTVKNNSAENNGGGFYVSYQSFPTLKHITIFENSAGKYGGGMYFRSASAVITNVTISNNTADSTGGGINYLYADNTQIKNAIIWNNTPDEIFKSQGNNLAITYSDIKGSYTGTGNINSDPLFYATTGDSAYYLTASSPCLDTGDPLSPHDPDGSRVDMGAFYYYHNEVIFPPTANFKADTTYGYFGDTRNFTDLSSQGTGAINKWHWDFGDGATDTVQNPAHVYDSTGIFSVTLIVEDINSNKDTMQKTDYLTIVNKPPTAAFSADITEWYKPLAVHFTDGSTAGSANIEEWSWDFGDDSLSSLKNPQHIYRDTGTYTVSLTVTDAIDSTDTKTRTDYITVLPGTYIAGGYVSGTWNLSGSPYVIGGEITVHSDSSLTIDPGVDVQFTGHYKFNVYGQLLAQGTATDSIIFTVQGRTSGWHGLRFYNTNNSVLSYCLILNGKATGTTSQDSCGGAIYCENAPVQINHCTLKDNIAYKDGGGIYCNLSDIQVSESKILSNTAWGSGGGIFGSASAIVITGDTLQNNVATFGGGIYSLCTADPYPGLMNVLIENNTAQSSGGGIFGDMGGKIDIQQSFIVGNSAGENGAGIYFCNSTFPFLTNVEIENNDAGSNGGGIYFNGTSFPVLSALNISGNEAANGGGIFFNAFADPNILFAGFPVTMNDAGQGGGIYFNNSTGPTLDNITITGNSASGENAWGGGIYLDNSSPALFNVTVELNTVFSNQSASGGGMYLTNFSSPHFSSVTINRNSVTGKMYASGGGISCYAFSSPLIDHSTVCLNIVSCEQQAPLGGGIYSSTGTYPNLTNVTVAYNTASNGAGGGFYANGSQANPSNLLLTNCILWNDNPQEVVLGTYGALSATYSDIEGGWAGNGNINMDPLFEDAINVNFHLSWPNYPVPGAKSPCIDAGDPAFPLDPDGTIADMGAFYFDQTNVPECYDFGDAPNPPFPTLFTDSAARHLIVAGVFLGNSIDADDDGQPTSAADGDDNDGNNDDDGVVFNSAFVPGTTVSVTVTASTNGFLNGWCDFNADGDWDDLFEQIFINTILNAGANSLNINVPETAALDTTFCRFRFNTTYGLNYDGTASDGEVEDYQVVIIPEEHLEDLAIWHFNEGQGNTAHDGTDNHNDGTIINPSWGTGDNGTPAISLDGLNGFVTVPHSGSLDITAPFSVQARIKCTGQNKGYYAIVDKYTYHSSGSNGFTFYLSGGKLRLTIYSGTHGEKSRIGTTDLRDSQWHYVFGCWDGDSIKVFVDGIREGANRWPFPPATTTQGLGIGKRLSGWGGAMVFDGIIDDVVISSDPASKFDFGDAPDPPYNTLTENDGAVHRIISDVHLGNLIDEEEDGIQDYDALGDDHAGYDDEDGVIFTSAIVPGREACVKVIASIAGKLNAWIDFNFNGYWYNYDTAEHIFTDEYLEEGVNLLSFSVPSDAVPGLTFARFRFSSFGGLSYIGFAPDGEVEDYMVEITEGILPWMDDFENYSAGSGIAGQGGWEMWSGLPVSATATVTEDNSYSGNQSLKIRGKADQSGDNIVHRFIDCTSGLWELSAWQYIPSYASGGISNFVLLNQYDCNGNNNNLSTQIEFDPDQNLVISDFDGSTLPLVKDHWVKIAVFIDLDNNTQSVYYDGLHLVSKSWTEGITGNGILDIAAVNLFGNTLENADVYYDDCLLRPVKAQTLNISEGWGGISTAIEPSFKNVETLFAPASDDLEIIYNYNGTYWPGQLINTLGNWDVTSGYITKVNDEISLEIYGPEPQTDTIYLSQGWNLIPVYSDVDAMSVLGGMPGFVVAKGIASSEVLWPFFNIFTLTDLIYGKSYLVNMSQAGSFVYPDESTKSSTPEMIPQNLSSPWNDFHFTPNTHIIVFPDDVLKMTEPGDMIGAFTSDGWCAGAVTITNPCQPVSLMLTGEDPTTGKTEGFIPDELISFKWYIKNKHKTVPLNVDYLDTLNYNGKFQINGLSIINGMETYTPEKANDFRMKINIYPNPSNGIFTLTGDTATIKVNVYSLSGYSVFHHILTLPGKIDLSDAQRGIYIIRIVSSRDIFYDKIIIQ